MKQCVWANKRTCSSNRWYWQNEWIARLKQLHSGCTAPVAPDTSCREDVHLVHLPIEFGRWQPLILKRSKLTTGSDVLTGLQGMRGPSTAWHAIPDRHIFGFLFRYYWNLYKKILLSVSNIIFIQFWLFFNTNSFILC